MIEITEVESASCWDWAAQKNSVGSYARIVRGQRCVETQEFFGEMSAALQFPLYFGWNWDALEECIRDLSDVHGPSGTVIIADAGAALSDPHARRVFGSIATGSLSESNMLTFVLQGAEVEIRERWNLGNNVKPWIMP